MGQDLVATKIFTCTTKIDINNTNIEPLFHVNSLSMNLQMFVAFERHLEQHYQRAYLIKRGVVYTFSPDHESDPTPRYTGSARKLHVWTQLFEELTYLRRCALLEVRLHSVPTTYWFARGGRVEELIQSLGLPWKLGFLSFYFLINLLMALTAEIYLERYSLDSCGEKPPSHVPASRDSPHYISTFLCWDYSSWNLL
jgi:hypothetical protein